MSDALQRHRALERELIYIRWKHAGLESKEEEAILDAMEEIWYELSEEEQDELNSEGTQSLIYDNDAKSSVGDRIAEDIKKRPWERGHLALETCSTPRDLRLIFREVA